MRRAWLIGAVLWAGCDDGGWAQLLDLASLDGAVDQGAPRDALRLDALGAPDGRVDAAAQEDAGRVGDRGPTADAAPGDATPPGDAAPDATTRADAAPDAARPVEGPSDEFADPPGDLLAAPGRWAVLHPERAEAVHIADGALNILAHNPPPGENWSWFEDRYGVLVHRPITGAFAATTRLRVVDAPNAEQPPTGAFNAGGLVIRDPAGTHQGDEDWVMYNIGAQGPTGYSREIKKTLASRSGLYLNPQPFESQALLVCRVGDAFRFWHWRDGAWQPERFQPGTTQNVAAAWPEVDATGAAPLQFDLPGLPATLQLGIMTGAWEIAGPDDRSRTQSFVDYVRVAPDAPQRFEDCPTAFPAP